MVEEKINIEYRTRNNELRSKKKKILCSFVLIQKNQKVKAEKG